MDELSLIAPNTKNSPRCTAKAKGSGNQCKNPALPPTTKCYYHGGASLRGVAHPSFKHGSHSKYLPKHLQKDYERAVADPELLSLKSQAALLATREMELTKQLSQMEAPAWTQAVAVLGDLEAAMTSKDTAALQKAFGDLRSIIREGADQNARYNQTWSELRQLIQEKTRIAQAESKRLEQVGGFVKTEDLMMVLVSILEAVKANVENPKARQAIQMRFNSLIDTHRFVKPVEVEVIENGEVH